jgi:protein O-GlcNAc transferase
MPNLQKLFNEAMFAFNNGNFGDAEKLFRKLLRDDRKNVPALNLLTVILMSMGRFSDAEDFIDRAVKLNQSSDVSFYNYGLILKHLNKPERALEQFNRALQLKRDVAQTWNNRGGIYNDLKRYPEAISDFNQALLLQPKYPEALVNKGKSLALLERYDEAFAVYDEALALKPDLAEAWLGRGNLFNHLKRYGPAIEAYDQALMVKPDLELAWLGRGNVLADLERFDEAFAAYGQALSLKPDMEGAWLGRGNVFFGLKRYDEAFAAYDKALTLRPDLAEAWLGRGNVLFGLKRYDDAFNAYDKAVTFKPVLENAWLGLGNVFFSLGRRDEAFAAYDKTLSLKPDLEAGWVGRGNVFNDLKRHEEAVAAYDQALSLKADLEEAWLGRGNVFTNLKRYEEAFGAYDKALLLRPDLENAWLGRGNVLADLRRYDEALAAYDRALSLRPDLEKAWLGRGNVFFNLKRYEEAFAAYDQALVLKPDLAEAWFGRGNAFNDLKQYHESFNNYDSAFGLEPDLVGLEGMRLSSKMFVCDWRNFDEDREHLMVSVNNGKENVPPFAFLAISNSAEDQGKYARLWSAKSHPASNNPVWRGEIYRHRKIRVAYVSADFHQHATSYLMASMFECHDESKFEITAVSIGPDDNSEMRRRLCGSFDRFIDARTFSDDRIASEIRELEIDLLIDLKGFTQDARTGIFARRPAPVQVNYLGYPGTIGADYIDYLIADRIVIPREQQPYYTEKIVYLPDSYQVNDATRLISDNAVSREEMGLPETGFVFCCFNNNYKITPEVFECWMWILKRTEGSVLWLLEDNDRAAENLRREATARDVGAERLVFAKRLPLADHLGRHRLADLFLDTLPYNAHTTASDALWAGLPVLTQIGATFAGRVAASLLNAVDLPEMITQTREEYRNMAVELASRPDKLAAIRAKLERNRLTTPLFDTQLFTRHVETAYQAMYERYQEGLPADHILVAQ